MSSPPPKASQLGSRILLALLVVGVAVYWFKRDRPVREAEEPPAGAEVSEPAPTSLQEVGNVALAQTAPDELGNSTALAPTNPANAFASEFKLCFAEYPGISTPQELVNLLVNSAALMTHEMALENLSIHDGTDEQRLTVKRRGDMAELIYFTVGADESVSPQGQAQLLSVEAAETAKQDFLRRGRTLRHQRKEVIALNNGLRAEIEWHDEAIGDVLVFQADRSIFCRQGQCQCRVQNSE